MTETVKVAKTCPECEAVHHVTVPKEGYARWRAGEYIQHVMPELSADDRETLMTGICPPCWDRLFPADEDEGDHAAYLDPGSSSRSGIGGRFW